MAKKQTLLQNREYKKPKFFKIDLSDILPNCHRMTIHYDPNCRLGMVLITQDMVSEKWWNILADYFPKQNTNGCLSLVVRRDLKYAGYPR